MNIFRFAPLAASLVALTFAANAHAAGPAPTFNYSIEQFQIDKTILVGGTPTMATIFRDTFDAASNTLAPNDLFAPNYIAGNAVGTAADYGIFGTFAADSMDGSGKLRLDNGGTAASTNAFGDTTYVQQARLLTSMDATNNGLKNNTSFAVTAVFDLTTPVLGTSYGIRLTDKSPTDALGNDSVSLMVRSSGSGAEIAFSKMDFLNPSNVVLDSDTLTASPYIALRLSHLDPTNNVVTASFAYLSSVGDLGSATWKTSDVTTTIFNGENFTRAEFRAVAAVPEADTWAMMAVGVGLIGLQLRRRGASSGSVLG